MGNTGKGILWDSHVGSGTLLWGTDVKERAGLAGFEFQLCHPALELLCPSFSSLQNEDDNRSYVMGMFCGLNKYMCLAN